MPRNFDDARQSIAEAPSANSVTLVDPNHTTALTGIRVFDVGQGDCFGLLDQQSRVFCYVDYGGLANHPEDGSPGWSAQNLAVSYASGFASIILTHWDKDHYYSAVRKNPQADQCTWLVPRQWISPQALLFAGRLNRARCWPESLGKSSAKFPVGAQHEIEIRKCQPFDPKALKEDRNGSGLVVTLNRKSGSVVLEYMLLPGDCHFDGIPPLPAGTIRALIAYHHGSQTHWKAKTGPVVANASANHTLVYSYGQRNWKPATARYQPIWDPGAVHTTSLRALPMPVPCCDIRW
ncbi:MAG: hypothetical protein JSS86_00635 [Cyanobacteria bacterium SZAS LIN-2]|nr:hypothetical protein [Cyanobacteria bacterium SZAS LIN-2]